MAIGQKEDHGGIDLYVNNIFKGIPANVGESLSTSSIGYGAPTQTFAGTSATITSLPVILTSGSLSTAGGATATLTFTLTGLVAGTPLDITFVGGTNTVWTIQPIVTATANTATVQFVNTGASALNGTVIFTLTTA